MVLFGPLVLFPQTLTEHGESVLLAGLVLTALPAGFGLAAVTAERLLPQRWSDRRRSVAGGLIAAVSAVALTVAAPIGVTAVLLALLGVGLGTYIPANNASIMAAIPAHTVATAGGMVNMTRGLGTALGVTAVTLALHAGQHLAGPGTGASLTMGLLAVCGLGAAMLGRSAPTGPHRRANGRGGGADVNANGGARQ